MTTNHSITIGRNMHGDLSAETSIPLGFDRREMRVSTRKTSGGGLTCTATVVQVAEDGRSYAFLMFGDYRKTLAADRGARCTAKNIEAMHRAALAEIEPVLAEARAKYAPAGLDAEDLEAMAEEMADKAQRRAA